MVHRQEGKALMSHIPNHAFAGESIIPAGRPFLATSEGVSFLDAGPPTLPEIEAIERSIRATIRKRAHEYLHYPRLAGLHRMAQINDTIRNELAWCRIRHSESIQRSIAEAKYEQRKAELIERAAR